MSTTNLQQLSYVDRTKYIKMARHLLKRSFNVCALANNPSNLSIRTSSALLVNRINLGNIHSFSDTATDTKMKGNWSNLIVEEVKPFVFNVQLNRPKKMNALSKDLWGEIGTVFQQLDSDPDCRAIILSGNGKMFCAGIDLSTLMEMGQAAGSEGDVARKAKIYYNIIRQFQNYHMALEKCQKPVICAIHNACIGGGTNMVSFGDIRYCTKDAWFQVKEAELGLAADVGALQQLPKVIGSSSLARELCFTARKFFSDEAKESGFVNRVFNDKEEMMLASIDLAEKIAQMSPVAIQGTKVNMNYSRDHSVDEGLEYIARWNMTMLQSEDLIKAVTKMMTKDEDPAEFSKL